VMECSFAGEVGLVIEGRLRLAEVLREIKRVLQAADSVFCESHDKTIGVLGARKSSSNCQLSPASPTKMLLTRQGWHASNAARSDLGPVILFFTGQKLTR
jgi:hypothetical protein